MASSRLSVPFLQKILPVSDFIPESNSSEENDEAFEEISLINILNRIRSLNYRSMGDYNIDMNK